MTRTIVITGALLAGLAVAGGAFGAHLLEGELNARRLAIFDTAVRYHMYHALALLACGWVADRAGQAGQVGQVGQRGRKWVLASVWCFGAGVVIFSGSLYALALSGRGWLGAITPVGGGLLLAGWALLIVAGVRMTVSETPKGRPNNHQDTKDTKS